MKLLPEAGRWIVLGSGVAVLTVVAWTRWAGAPAERPELALAAPLDTPAGRAPARDLEALASGRQRSRETAYAESPSPAGLRSDRRSEPPAPSHPAGRAGPVLVPAGAPLAVQGIVLDERGLPIADSAVTWRPATRRPATGRRAEVGRGPLGMPMTPNTAVHRTRTASDGTFVFEEGDAADGGTLSYARELFYSGAPKSAVDTSGAWHVLRLPAAEPAARLFLDTLDLASGAPVAPTQAHFEVRGAPAGPGTRNPQRSMVLTDSGLRVDVMSPGSWRVWVAGPDTPFASLDFEVGPDGGDVYLALELRSYAGAQWSGERWDVNSEAELAPDPENGFADWVPQQPRAFGDPRSDSHFARTLRFDPGGMRGALLMLSIKAESWMASNDGLYLEYAGGRRFHWSRSVAELAGGTWKEGRRMRLYLDLAKLPGHAGTPVSLLDQLVDGRLDVVLQDDTSVNAVSLRILR